MIETYAESTRSNDRHRADFEARGFDVLRLDASQREALLAGLEIALAVTRGELADAIGLAWQSYDAARLAERLDGLADLVFAVGRRRDRE